MSRRGSRFVPDPHRGLYTREDLDIKCHHELEEEINSYLAKHATKDPDNHTALKMVAVDPDGTRRASRDALTFWHPKELAQELRRKQKFPEMGSDEDKRRQYHQEVKDFRTQAYSLIQAEEEYVQLRKEQEREAVQQQFAWERALMDKDC